MQAKQIYLKRKYLSDYEVISRTAGESTRAYVNRYHRVEKSLLSIGIDVGLTYDLTYDSESRGSRLLDRAKLSHEQQRIILVGTSQSLNFDDIKSAASQLEPHLGKRAALLTAGHMLLTMATARNLNKMIPTRRCKPSRKTMTTSRTMPTAMITRTAATTS